MAFNKEDQEHIKDFLDEMDLSGKSQRTIDGYRGYFKAISQIIAEDYPGLVNMKKNDLRALVKALKKSGLQPSSIQVHIGALSSFYTFLENEDLIELNLITAYKVRKMLPKIDHTAKEMERDFLEPHEFEAYMQACYRTRNYIRNQMILLILISPGGPRRKELRGILVENLQRGKGRILLQDTKGGKPRFIYPTPRAWDKIDEHLKITGKTRGNLVGLSYIGIYSIVLSIKEKILPEDFETREQYDILMAKNIHPHRFRASACTWLRRDKVSSRTIMKMFGWKNRKMIERYDTVIQEDVDDEIGDYFKKTNGNGAEVIK